MPITAAAAATVSAATSVTRERMNARRMRQHNSHQVLRVVKNHGPLSRTEITEHTHLSPPTVAALIGNLVRAGLVEEQGAGKSKGGRKPQLVSFNSHCGAIIGGNIETSCVQLVLADMQGEWIARREIKVKSETRPKPLLRRIINAVKQMCREELQPHTPLLAVTIGAPGMTDVERGVVLEAANLDGWVDVPAQSFLSEALGVPVIVDNDVNFAAIGEHWRGAGRAVHNFVFISLGTGIGAGIVIDDKIHRGAKWYAGEISHLNVDFREWNTDFAAAGYLETYLGDAPPAHSLMQSAKPSRAKPKRCGGMRDYDAQALQKLGAAIANIATIIDPEIIILGGSHGSHLPDGMLSVIKQVAARIAPNCPEILRTELGGDASLYGSLKVGLNRANDALHLQLLESVLAT